MSDKFHIECVNESSLLIRFNAADKMMSTDALSAVAAFIRTTFEFSITDVIFSYSTLLISIDNQTLNLAEFKANVERAVLSFLFEESQFKAALLQQPIIKIPVFYHSQVAPDLNALADFSGLSVDAVIQAHCSKIYPVCAIGFAPGFAYLGGVDKKIAKSRLDTPRLVVAKGSVGIAGVQTGVYPAESPGGWNIIGRTPLSMLTIDENNNIQCRVNAGGKVQFYPIDKTQFLALGGCLS